MRKLIAALSIAAVASATVVLAPTHLVAQTQTAPVESYPTAWGPMTFTVVEHATFVINWRGQTYCVDPGKWVEFGAGGNFPATSCSVIFITHGHRLHEDHCVPEIVTALMGPATTIIATEEVYDTCLAGVAMNDNQRMVVTPGDEIFFPQSGLRVEAIAAENTNAFVDWHPHGCCAGFVLQFGGAAGEGLRMYIPGDTDVLPQMANLGNIQIAFLPLWAPFTMNEEQAAQAVAMIRPDVVYPYHYGNGRRGGDPTLFAQLVAGTPGNATEVRILPWYWHDGEELGDVVAMLR